MRYQTRFAPPSSHIFCTSSSVGIAEMSGKPPRMLSRESGCGGCEASPTVCHHLEVFSISQSCLMGCCLSPYTFPGHTGTPCSHWRWFGKFTIGLCVFWWHLALPGCWAPEEAGFLLVKVFLVLVEALEMVYKEDFVEKAHPQKLLVPLALDHYPEQGIIWDIHGHDPGYHCWCHWGYFPVDWSL